MNYIKIDKENKKDFLSVLPDNLADDLGISLGAYTEDGNVCGAISLSFDGTQYDLDWIYVVPEKRNMGLGKSLLKEVKRLVADIGICPIRARFDTSEENGLYLFFNSVSDADLIVDVDFSHYRYATTAKEFMESTKVDKKAKPHLRLSGFWKLSEEQREDAFREAEEHLIVTDFERFESLCEKPLCIAVSNEEELLAYMLVQNTPAGDLSLSYLSSKNYMAFMLLLMAAASEVKNAYGDRKIFFDVVSEQADSLAQKIFPNAEKIPVYEADF